MREERRQDERRQRRGQRRWAGVWLLTAILERGFAARHQHHWEVARFERPLSRRECRALLGAPARLRFLPRARPRAK